MRLYEVGMSYSNCAIPKNKSVARLIIHIYTNELPVHTTIVLEFINNVY